MRDGFGSEKCTTSRAHLHEAHTISCIITSNHSTITVFGPKFTNQQDPTPVHVHAAARTSKNGSQIPYFPMTVSSDVNVLRRDASLQGIEIGISTCVIHLSSFMRPHDLRFQLEQIPCLTPMQARSGVFGPPSVALSSGCVHTAGRISECKVDICTT